MTDKQPEPVDDEPEDEREHKNLAEPNEDAAEIKRVKGIQGRMPRGLQNAQVQGLQTGQLGKGQSR